MTKDIRCRITRKDRGMAINPLTPASRAAIKYATSALLVTQRNGVDLASFTISRRTKLSNFSNLAATSNEFDHGHISCFALSGRRKFVHHRVYLSNEGGAFNCRKEGDAQTRRDELPVPNFQIGFAGLLYRFAPALPELGHYSYSFAFFRQT